MVRAASDIAQLTVAERLDLIDALWASLRAQPDALPPTAAERASIDERRAEHQRQPENAVTWDVVRSELLADQIYDEATTTTGAGERGG